MTHPLLTLCGNATADAELVFGRNGDARCTFTLAVTPRVKRDGEFVDGETQFYRCTAWRAFGESVASSVTRGMRLLVQGRFTPRPYEKDGQTRVSLDLDLEHVGAEMRYSSITARKSERSPGGSREPAYAAGSSSDPWGAGPATPSASTEEPPF